MMSKKKSRYCKFNGCQNDSTSKGVHFHRFPKDKTRCETWVEASKNVKLKGLSAEYLYKNVVLCSDHFQDWCFMNINTKKSLVHNALPASPKPLPSECERINLIKETPTNETPMIIKIKTSLLHNALPASPIECERINSTSETITSEVSCVRKSASEELKTPAPTQAFAFNLRTPHTAALSPIFPNLNQPTNFDFLESTNSNNPISRKSNRMYSPREKLLAGKVKRYRDRIRKFEEKFKSYKKKYPVTQSLKETLSSQGVSEKLSNFMLRQVSLDVNKKGKRYTEYDKIQAYKIFCKSPEAYTALKDVLELPSPQTLHRFISTKFSYPGINSDSISELKKILEGKSSQENKFPFDEVSSKPNLENDSTKDQVIGLENLGNECRNNSIANQDC